MTVDAAARALGVERAPNVPTHSLISLTDLSRRGYLPVSFLSNADRRAIVDGLVSQRPRSQILVGNGASTEYITSAAAEFAQNNHYPLQFLQLDIEFLQRGTSSFHEVAQRLDAIFALVDAHNSGVESLLASRPSPGGFASYGPASPLPTAAESRIVLVIPRIERIIGGDNDLGKALGERMRSAITTNRILALGTTSQANVRSIDNSFPDIVSYTDRRSIREPEVDSPEFHQEVAYHVAAVEQHHSNRLIIDQNALTEATLRAQGMSGGTLIERVVNLLTRAAEHVATNFTMEPAEIARLQNKLEILEDRIMEVMRRIDLAQRRLDSYQITQFQQQITALEQEMISTQELLGKMNAAFSRLNGEFGERLRALSQDMDRVRTTAQEIELSSRRLTPEQQVQMQQMKTELTKLRTLAQTEIEPVLRGMSIGIIDGAPTVNRLSIKTVFSAITGRPTDNPQLLERVSVVDSYLTSRIPGQPQFVSAAARAARQTMARTREPKPFTMLFYGISGGGKSFTAETPSSMASTARASGNACSGKTLRRKTVLAHPRRGALHGSPLQLHPGGGRPNFVGYDEGGSILLKWVRNHLYDPTAVLAIDEIQLMDRSVMQVLRDFMQWGRLTPPSGGGAIEGFEGIIAMTSNHAEQDVLGEAIERTRGLREIQLAEEAKAAGSVEVEAEHRRLAEIAFGRADHHKLRIEQILRTDLTAPFYNRIGIKEKTQLTTPEANISLAASQIARTVSKPFLRLGLRDVSVTPEAVGVLVEHGYDPMSGARAIQRLVGTTIKDALVEIEVELALSSRTWPRKVLTSKMRPSRSNRKSGRSGHHHRGIHPSCEVSLSGNQAVPATPIVLQTPLRPSRGLQRHPRNARLEDAANAAQAAAQDHRNCPLLPSPSLNRAYGRRYGWLTPDQTFRQAQGFGPQTRRRKRGMKSMKSWEIGSTLIKALCISGGNPEVTAMNTTHWFFLFALS